jgi:cob(I)alamin adenosyltransferase
MGHRLSRIYTRTGDDGSTGLADGRRVPKDHPRIEAIGAVDELNSALGVLLAGDLPADIHDLLTGIQHDLFDLGGELSAPGGAAAFAESRVAELERALDRLNANLGPLKEFILPGGSRAAAAAHLARTACRRAERRLITLRRAEPLAPTSVAYLNRLSDLLFVVARAANRHAGRADVLWRPNRKD